MPDALEQIKAIGTIIASDSGDYSEITEFKPQDATTNPTLIHIALRKTEARSSIAAAIKYGNHIGGNTNERIDAALDYLLVLCGKDILDHIPGRVSTEIDARFSFDVESSVNKALRIIEIYRQLGIDKSRILIKIASTWEGIQAAKILQTKHGINCNMTLIFSEVQAIAAAEAGVAVVSPFVGRILDWHKQVYKKEFNTKDDPGVHRVHAIYNYFKKHGYKTLIMGASFRNIGEIKELAGCDLLTISPSLLEALRTTSEPLPRKLDPATAASMDIPKRSYLTDESTFRFEFNADAMAVEKLREGIVKFADDLAAVKDILWSESKH